MSEETTNEQPTTEQAPENELPVFETGFMLLKAKDTGNWHVLTDISSPLRLEREVSINEVRVGSAEAAHSISQQQLAALIITALSPQDPTTIEE